MEHREEHEMKQVHVTAESMSDNQWIVACSEDDFTLFVNGDPTAIMSQHMAAHGVTHVVVS